jgi:GDPmannose 4,6-dehydratase
MSKKVALITGITGQDGSYLAELLLSKDYEVHGIIRRSSSVNTERIDKIFNPEDYTYIHYGDLEDGIDDLLYQLQPDEVYNLGAMSHVRISFDIPVYTAKVTDISVLRILEGIRKLNLTKKTRFYQASSSEMFGITPPP